MGTRVINSSRALFLSSNKLVSDQIMKGSGLRIPSTLFCLGERILEREETFLFPTLVKPLYGRSHGIAYVESADSLRNSRRKWVYLRQFIPNNGGVTRIYKLGDVVRSFFHPQKGRPREVSVPDDIMEIDPRHRDHYPEARVMVERLFGCSRDSTQVREGGNLEEQRTQPLAQDVPGAPGEGPALA